MKSYNCDKIHLFARAGRIPREARALGHLLGPHSPERESVFNFANEGRDDQNEDHAVDEDNYDIAQDHDQFCTFLMINIIEISIIVNPDLFCTFASCALIEATVSQSRTWTIEQSSSS